MSIRRGLVLAGVGLVAWSLVACYQLLSQAASADTGSSRIITKVDLKDQLELGLRARRPVEFEFIAQVLELVDQEVLPRPLVQRAFNWARKKPSKRVQYFEFALRTLAKRRGIELEI